MVPRLLLVPSIRVPWDPTDGMKKGQNTDIYGSMAVISIKIQFLIPFSM